MAIVTTLANTSTSIAANVSGNVYVIGPDAIVTTAADAVDGANTTTSKRIIIQGSLVAEQDGVDLGSGGTGGFNQVHVQPGGSIFAESAGIEAEGGNNLFVNEGSIFGLSDGIFLLNDGNTVTNYANITGGSDGVDFTGNSNVLTNYGRITGGDEGVEIAGMNNRIYNYGSIIGSDDFAGNEAVEISSSNGEINTLYNFGKIVGITSIGATSGDETIINRGSLSGAVNLGAGNDRYDGRGGQVTGDIAGGSGNDLYLIDDAGISLVESVGQGTDTVATSVSFALPVNFENMSLLGSDDIDAFGNSQNNMFTPNSGANFIDGGEGTDTISYGQAQTGVVAQLFGGFDSSAINPLSLGSVTAPMLRTAGVGGADGDILVNVEHLFGSAFDDILLGSVQADLLRGQAGDDFLFGNAGNDALEGGAGADRLNGGAGSDFAAYTTAAAGVRADLILTGTNTGDAAGDAYANIQNLRGSMFDDTLLGT
ncbi:MAG TPA: hypothetical protein VKA18_07190, partial [Alphaproteobacteria bacterium]|nr:hypothetical protein [Alphaproteobacteria bacterium]